MLNQIFCCDFKVLGCILGPKAYALAVLYLFQFAKRTGRNEENIGSINRDFVAIWQFYIYFSAFNQLEESLLYTFSTHILAGAAFSTAAAALIDFVNHHNASTG